MNTQTPMRLDRDALGTVLVHSVFETIQGEGPFAGHRATFVRLIGCNLQCPWCDTEYTTSQFASSRFTPTELLYAVSKSIPLVVITGGEPFRQNINRLVHRLLGRNHIVQIETNGVLYPGDAFPWVYPEVTVVCSPKTGRIHPKTARLVHAYKYVLSHDSVAPDGLPERALDHHLAGNTTVARPPEGWVGPIYVQPMDAKDPVENQKNIEAVVHTVMNNSRYIMGVQMHKLTGLP